MKILLILAWRRMIHSLLFHLMSYFCELLLPVVGETDAYGPLKNKSRLQGSLSPLWTAIINANLMAQTIQSPVETTWKKCVVQNVTQLFLRRHLQSLLCTIIHKPCVISRRHSTEGTGASEAGLILHLRLIVSTTNISNGGHSANA